MPIVENLCPTIKARRERAQRILSAIIVRCLIATCICGGAADIRVLYLRCLRLHVVSLTTIVTFGTDLAHFYFFLVNNKLQIFY